MDDGLVELYLENILLFSYSENVGEVLHVWFLFLRKKDDTAPYLEGSGCVIYLGVGTLFLTLFEFRFVEYAYFRFAEGGLAGHGYDIN